MGSVLLYAVTILVWGTSWYAIKLQIGDVPPEVSVAWRFGLASLCIFAYGLLRGQRLQLNGLQHRMMVVLGLLLFGVNLTLVYYASEILPSGLVSVTFSIIAVMNIVNGRLVLGLKNPWMTWIGAVVGVLGLALVFRQDLTAAFLGTGASDTIRGILFCIAGTYVASLGNVWAVRAQTAGIDVIRSTAWGMLYGSLALFMYSALRGMPLGIPLTPRYLGGLAYLAIFASVVGFLSYLTLLRRIGPSRAGYVAVVFPVVALIVSAFLENFVPGVDTVIGGVVVVAGNMLVLRRKPS